MISGEMLEIRRQQEEAARKARLAAGLSAVKEALSHATREREAAERTNQEFNQKKEMKNEKAKMDMNGDDAAGKLVQMHGEVINVEAKNTLAREEIKTIQEHLSHYDDKIRRLIHEKRELWDRINSPRQRHWGFRFFD